MTESETNPGLPYSTDKLAEGLRKSREFRGITVKDCSKLLGIPNNKLQNYEKGKYLPSLAELEALSYVYSVPLAALFNPGEYPEIFKIPDANQLQQLLQIRKRIISTTLQIAFERKGKSLQEISKIAGLSVAKLKRFLDGEIEIPINDLQRITSGLDLDLNTLMDSESQIGKWQDFQKKKIAFAKLPETTRSFLTEKANWPFVDVVEKMKKLDPNKLESLAESFRELAELSLIERKAKD